MPTATTPDSDLFRARKTHTLKDRRKQAAKALRLYRSGIGPWNALKQAGLTPCMTAALRECDAGGGPLTEIVRAGNDRSKWPDTVPTTSISLLRWHFRLPAINGTEDPGNGKLRRHLVRLHENGTTYPEMARKTGLNRSTIRLFTTGKVPRMRSINRDRVWAAFPSVS